MVLDRPGGRLQWTERPAPQPQQGQLLLDVRACAVCRTDLHVMNGELPWPGGEVTLGHEVVASVRGLGAGVSDFAPGDRVGVPWLGRTCGRCSFCAAGRENLCPEARFTGYTLPGGFAEQMVADARYCFALPAQYADAEVAPLLCAGLIGYRCLRAAGDARALGIYGFGAAAHLVTQVARFERRDAHAFTREGDADAQAFARELGAIWAGPSTVPPPTPLDAAILFASDGALVPAALRAVRPGGTVVCGGIHMSEIPAFPYAWLWGERVVRSVANLTRADAVELLTLAPRVPLRSTVQRFALEDAGDALRALAQGRLRGAAVLERS